MTIEIIEAFIKIVAGVVIAGIILYHAIREGTK